MRYALCVMSSPAIKAQLTSACGAVMDEIGFSVLKYSEKTPVLAACTRCQLKFLTPLQMMKDWAAASEYLWRKYSNHRCANPFSHNEDKNHAPLSTLQV
ncbi:MAG: hypothetical protein WA741_33385, partial [Candidatus Sulfotelmatobacter sp.]